MYMNEAADCGPTWDKLASQFTTTSTKKARRTEINRKIAEDKKKKKKEQDKQISLFDGF